VEFFIHFQPPKYIKKKKKTNKQHHNNKEQRKQIVFSRFFGVLYYSLESLLYCSLEYLGLWSVVVTTFHLARTF
jgi:hypothetical protein